MYYSACEESNASYSTFDLEKIMNLSDITNYKFYPKLEASFERLKATPTNLFEITKNLQIILEEMLVDSEVQIKTYRLVIGQPTPEKDIATFTDQMQRVSLQIHDVATASRMTTLGSRARRLQPTLMQPLEQLRGEILYHLTALELQMDPWMMQINQTLNDLHKIQTFIETDARDVCENRTVQYTQRLTNHLTTYRDQTMSLITSSLAPCRPLFDIFNVYRNFICRHFMDPINGLWFITLICIFLWTLATPLSLMLSTSCKKLKQMKELREDQ